MILEDLNDEELLSLFNDQFEDDTQMQDQQKQADSQNSVEELLKNNEFMKEVDSVYASTTQTQLQSIQTQSILTIQTDLNEFKTISEQLLFNLSKGKHTQANNAMEVDDGNKSLYSISSASEPSSEGDDDDSSSSDESDKDGNGSDEDQLDNLMKRKAKLSLFGFQVKNKNAKNGKNKLDLAGDGDENLPQPDNILDDNNSSDGSSESSSEEEEKKEDSNGKGKTTKGGKDKDKKKKFKPKKIHIPKEEQEDCEPDEVIVTNSNGQQMKMITTVSGQIPLDFNNTKIIKDGKVQNFDDFSNQQSVANLNKVKESHNNNNHNHAHDDLTDRRNYATDIGKKAGMDSVDQDEVKRVIMESSCKSEFFKTQEQKHRQVEQKVRRYLYKLRNFRANKELWFKTKEIVKKLVEQFMRERQVMRTWMHIDMDMFYAAVEIRDNPSLKKKPVAVGDNTMITTTNYIARKYGVKSAMPGFIGRRLCPHLVFIKPNYPKYKKASDQFKRILAMYDPKLASVGLDEANLDLTDYLVENKMDNDLGKIFIAQKIREQIFLEMGMTASAGIACNKMLAKICSELNKPNGQTYMYNDEVEILKFMMDLPVRKIPGVGKVNEHILSGLNIYSCKDLVEKATEVYVTFTEHAFQFLVKSALGISKVMHEKEEGVVSQRSMGVSCTFKPIHRYNQFKEKMFRLAAELEVRAAQNKVMGKTLVLEFKTFKFETKIKSMTFPHYLYSQNQFKKYGILLLNQAWPIEASRLMGLRLSNMRDRRKDKGVKVCPEVQLTDKDLAGPESAKDNETQDNNEEEDKNEEIKIEFTGIITENKPIDEFDNEGIEDPEIEQKHDEENMQHAREKILKQKHGNIPEKKKKKLKGDKDILTENSRSMQSWSNVPRFHMDKIMGKSEKEKKQERVQKILKKHNQRGIESFMNEADKYLSKTDQLSKQLEELSKIKNKNDGINNCRSIRNKLKKKEEKQQKDIDGGMFGVPKSYHPI